MVNPYVDLLTAPWSPTTPTSWWQPLLVDLSPWRATHQHIKKVNAQLFNNSDIVFVADFPNMRLDNYISPNISANITVLSGYVLIVKKYMLPKNVEKFSRFCEFVS